MGRGEERRSLATTMAMDLASEGVAEVVAVEAVVIEDAEVAEEVATMVTMVLVANMTRVSRDFRFYFYPAHAIFETPTITGFAAVSSPRWCYERNGG